MVIRFGFSSAAAGHFVSSISHSHSDSVFRHSTNDAMNAMRTDACTADYRPRDRGAWSGELSGGTMTKINSCR